MSAGLYGSVAGVSRKVKKLYANVNGVNRELKELWIKDSGGVSRKVFVSLKVSGQQRGYVDYDEGWASSYVYADGGLGCDVNSKKGDGHSVYAQLIFDPPIDFSPSVPIFSSSSTRLEYWDDGTYHADHSAGISWNGGGYDLTDLLLDSDGNPPRQSIVIYPKTTGQTSYLQFSVYSDSKDGSSVSHETHLEVPSGKLYINNTLVELIDPITTV